MKKVEVTTVKWQWPEDVFLFVRIDGAYLRIDSVEIKSQHCPHPAGRCANVVVNGYTPGTIRVNRQSYTHAILRTRNPGSDDVQSKFCKEFGYLGISSSLFPDIVGHDGRCYSVQWKLRRNEEFLDGAVRIGCEILKAVGAVANKSEVDTKMILGSFTVTQVTIVEIKNSHCFGNKIKGHYAGTDWQPIECWLRYKHSLQI